MRRAIRRGTRRRAKDVHYLLDLTRQIVYIIYMTYEWDSAKAEINEAKHGVAFEAALDFDWDTALVAEDDRFDYGEPRFIAFGLIADRLHVLVYTMRGETVRIISLRKANEKEETIYDETKGD